MALRIVGVAAAGLVLHLLVGWAWTIVAGVAGGLSVAHRGWLVGAAGVGLEWAVLVGYNYGAAGAAVQAMVHTMGGILGNTPGSVVVAATVLLGMLLGGAGGLVGMAVRQAFRRAD